LEVQREVVGATDEDKSVAKTDAKRGHVGGLGEESERHERVFRNLPLDEEEEDNCDHSKNDQAKCIGTIPWMGDATRLETKKEHHHSSDDSDDAEPVDGLDAGDERRSWCLNLQEKYEQEERSTVKWEVDVNLRTG
jgi:hypothetical protein